MTYVKEISKGRVVLGPGTTYGALKTLSNKKWIQALESEEGSRKKEYVITSRGKKVVSAEIERLEELLENGKKLTKRL